EVEKLGADKPPYQRDVRFTPKADMCGATRDVRFTPKSGHVQRTSSCLLWANSGLMQCSNWDRYSITSSASATRDLPERDCQRRQSYRQCPGQVCHYRHSSGGHKATHEKTNEQSQGTFQSC